MLRIFYEETNEPIDVGQIQSFTITSSIYSLFITGSLTLKDIGSIWSNTIRVGDKFTVAIKEGNKKYFFRVERLEKNSSNEFTTPSTVIIHLIDESYIQQTVGTMAYRGPISNIITTILSSKKFSNNIRIKPSDDSSVVRYRVEELEADFIERIIKLASHKQSPMYCYTDLDKTTHFESLESMENSTIQYTLKSLSSEKDPLQKVIDVYSIDVISSGFLSQAQSYKFTSKHIQHTDVAIQSVEIGTAHSIKEISTSLQLQPKGIADWSVPYFDGINKGLRDRVDEKISNLYAIAVTNSTLATSIRVGTVVNVIVSSHTKNLNDPHLITKLSHIFLPDGLYTRMELTRAIH